MNRRALSQLITNYGMGIVLALLCIYYSWATLQQHHPAGESAGYEVAAKVLEAKAKRIFIVTGPTDEDDLFIKALLERLESSGIVPITLRGADPPSVRQQLVSGPLPDAIASSSEPAKWLPSLLERIPAAKNVPIISPESYLFPSFLQKDNLLNIANQIVVIAVIAVGMSMVIITGGIDLSVGSLVALAAVIAGILIRDHAGGASAKPAGLIACSIIAVAATGFVGAFSGAMITFFRVPPFIATLGMMQVASGLAYILAAGQSISDIPPSFTALGRGLTFGIPNAVILMLIVYAIAHILMSRTKLGRYIYAVGGNAEAARLSGVRVGGIVMTVYIVSGIFAGLGGIILASQLKSSAPTYGQSYELYVIAAVVVGGTSLAGGEGRILGTLIGALIIAVIQNGMNLTGVESYRQKIVLGLVILGAVLLDMLKKRPWKLPRWLARVKSLHPAKEPHAPS
jgi:ribose transport system permease protein